MDGEFQATLCWLPKEKQTQQRRIRWLSEKNRWNDIQIWGFRTFCDTQNALLHEGAHYKEFIFYYEKKPAGYRRVSKEAIQAYCYLKEYDKAITLAKERASEEKGKYKKYSMEYDYMLYSFDWFFIKSYYKENL